MTAPAVLSATMQPGLDGVQEPWPFGLLETLGLFVAIPLGVFALVILFVYGSSWTRSGRTSGSYGADPLWLTSPAAGVTGESAPALPRTTTASGEQATDEQSGGTGARW